MLDLRKIIFIVLLTAIGLGYWQYTRMEKKVETAQKNEATNQVVGEINKAGAVADRKSDKASDNSVVAANTNTEGVRNNQDNIKLKADKELRQIENSRKPKIVVKPNTADTKVVDTSKPPTTETNEYRQSLEKKSEVYIDSLWEAYNDGQAIIKAVSI
jgi:cell division protein FtsI/penicillin-binding protein 2